MDNQHRKIKGYRELSEEEIALMNRVKSLGEQVKELIKDIESTESSDKRWVNIAKTKFQIGGMALTRSVAKPDFFF